VFIDSCLLVEENFRECIQIICYSSSENDRHRFNYFVEFVFVFFYYYFFLSSIDSADYIITDTHTHTHTQLKCQLFDSYSQNSVKTFVMSERVNRSVCV